MRQCGLVAAARLTFVFNIVVAEVVAQQLREWDGPTGELAWQLDLDREVAERLLDRRPFFLSNANITNKDARSRFQSSMQYRIQIIIKTTIPNTARFALSGVLQYPFKVCLHWRHHVLRECRVISAVLDKLLVQHVLEARQKLVRILKWR